MQKIIALRDQPAFIKYGIILPAVAWAVLKIGEFGLTTGFKPQNMIPLSTYVEFLERGVKYPEQIRPFVINPPEYWPDDHSENSSKTYFVESADKTLDSKLTTATDGPNPDTDLCSVKLNARKELADMIEDKVKKTAMIMGHPEDVKIKGGWLKYLNTYTAQICTESSLDMKAVSSAGALGLPQIMPQTFEDLPRMVSVLQKSEWIAQDYRFEWKRKDYESSVDVQIEAGWIAHMHNILLQGGNIKSSYAGYNAGPNNVKKAKKKAKSENLKNPNSFKTYYKFLPQPGVTKSYVDKTRKLSKELQQVKLSDVVLHYEHANLVNEYVAKATKFKDNENYKESLRHWLDIGTVAKRSYTKGEADFWAGFCYEQLGDFDNAQKYYLRAQKSNSKVWKKSGTDHLAKRD